MLPDRRSGEQSYAPYQTCRWRKKALHAGVLSMPGARQKQEPTHIEKKNRRSSELDTHSDSERVSPRKRYRDEPRRHPSPEKTARLFTALCGNNNVVVAEAKTRQNREQENESMINC